MTLPALRIAVLVVLSYSANLSAQTYPVPLVNTPLAPSAVKPGGHGFSLTLNGNGFTSSSKVLWNGTARLTSFVSNIQLKARILASDIATPSTATVTVANPGKNHTSNPVFLQVALPQQSITMNPIATGLPAINSPLAVDLNGDGIADLVVLQTFEVDVALGLGGGTFATPQVIPFSTPVSSVITGSFLSSGKPDLIVASESVWIVPNHGNGTFGTPIKVTAETPYVMSLAVADLNGDGLLDLIQTQSSGSVYVYLRKANGQFQNPVAYPAGNSPNSVAIGDLNRDGIADLVVLDSGDDSVAVFLGNGDGTFQPATFYSAGQSGDFPGPVILGDFNGDGILDVARAAANFMAGVGVALGNGDGTLQPFQLYQTSSYGLVAGDFNSDGILDVATGLNGSGTGILTGKGDGTFSSLYNFGFPVRGLGVIGAADFDNNGNLDVAAFVYDGTSYTVTLYVH